VYITVQLHSLLVYSGYILEMQTKTGVVEAGGDPTIGRTPTLLYFQI